MADNGRQTKIRLKDWVEANPNATTEEQMAKAVELANAETTIKHQVMEILRRV